MPSVLASDIPGSSLTIAFTNYLQDAAYRKFLVDAANRHEAIDTVVSWLGTEAGGGADGYNHPNVGDFNSTICVNRMTASAVGPDRWIVSVEYIASEFTGFPGGAVSTLMNAKVSFESVQVWCAPTAFDRGLPYGGQGTEFVHPGKTQSTDPNDPPKPYIWSRSIVSIGVPFSTSTNPLTSVEFSGVGKTNNGTITIGGVEFTAGQLRFDGVDLVSTSNSGALGAITYSGSKSYTACSDGFSQQVLKFGDGAGSTPEGWYCENVDLYD